MLMNTYIVYFQHNETPTLLGHEVKTGKYVILPQGGANAAEHLSAWLVPGVYCDIVYFVAIYIYFFLKK